MLIRERPTRSEEVQLLFKRFYPGARPQEWNFAVPSYIATREVQHELQTHATDQHELLHSDASEVRPGPAADDALRISPGGLETETQHHRHIAHLPRTSPIYNIFFHFGIDIDKAS